ncbi:alpha,alpha-trehalose-phosphate synthase [UDP-forming] [Cimex lectularius]|uniref:Trehalose-6-phosphate synthase n=1 Tax=Cimex lectularius TaxID=79782 RepID=A0A8I6S4C7_CIMLE|nr:alpha,alpha-trehalose-phosphate synthase [UDP-forming] [Cimex lectularius]
MAEPASNLLVLSNRLPFVLKFNKDGKLERNSSAGGLVTAVAPVVIENDGIWVGWPGALYTEGSSIPESNPDDKSPSAQLKSKNIIPVALAPSMYQSYYNGCCNETFWPLFHSMPDRATFAVDYWKSYSKANKIFAEKTFEGLQRLSGNNGDPLIWVHDYHLMLAPLFIRKQAKLKEIHFKLAFFLHIPFPPWDIFRLFPWSDKILQGILSCDLVGFHTYDYSINFIDCCNRRLGCRIDRSEMLVEHGGRSVKVCPLPIGIPFERFSSLAEKAPKLSNRTIILGVDRLDYTKGLPQRLKAFEMLLANYPEHIEKVEMLQIAVPSRTDVKEYQDLKLEMDQLVGRINGRFTTPNWSPIRYIYDTVSQDILAGFYRDAAVAFITPLRDGMNLVAKEYVACQVNSPPGVLIISPFAGAGESMNEAIICNPYELKAASEALHRALTMPEDERILRMNYLRKREQKRDVKYWLNKFMDEMEQLNEGNGKLSRVIQPITLEEFDKYFAKEDFQNKKLALLLDYDGTLAPISPHPDLAILPEPTKQLLQKLANHPDIHISIISGRKIDNLKMMVGIENITYAGSHGLDIIHPDGTKFTHPMPAEYENKAKSLLKHLQDQVCKDGAWVENKGVYLTFHYRNTPIDAQPELLSKAQDLIEKEGFVVSHAHSAIEAKPPINWNKGRAAIYILRTAFGLDWSERISIIFAGDDVTDEDAIQVLKGMAYTFRVTNDLQVKTDADVRLSSIDSIYTLLCWVERRFVLSSEKKEISSSPAKKPLVEK